MTGKPSAAPFPYPGGKRLAARLVWERFGDVAHYIEPFAGSLAVLLERPGKPQDETVNDKDGFIVNFWRAIKSDPDAVARWASDPASDVDLLARHRWLVGAGRSLIADIAHDPHAWNAQVAGWWVWGLSLWFGHGWCHAATPDEVRSQAMRLHRVGVHRKTVDLVGQLRALQERLSNVRVASGDWSRVLTPAAIGRTGSVGIFLDPPYGTERKAAYAHNEPGLSDDVARWAIEHGSDRRLRICLAGYDDAHVMPGNWEKVRWFNGGGLALQGEPAVSVRNEVLWFSPGCLSPTLFGAA